MFAPFRVRSYRFQWPADLATSWAFEMESLILSWYVLVETRSVLLLTVFASLLYVGTILAPMFGVMGDRIGHRNLLCGMRAAYATLSTALMIFIFSGTLTPVHVLVIATLMGIVRPSDLGMRSSLIGDTMPAGLLMGAMSIQRTTQDSARVAGSLAGAGLVATLGMGSAYVIIVCLYTTSFVLTLKARGAGAARQRVQHAADLTARASPWHDLKAGLAYVWSAPHLLALMCIAFLVNLTAFPLTNGLLPYVAKDIYFTGQTGLAYLAASFAGGALLGSVVLSRIGHAIYPARMMIVCCIVWYTLVFVFAQMPSPVGGIPTLILAGLAQSLCMVPMSATLLRTTGAPFRGRVMGIRMLMIYGVPIGLLTAGPLIGRFGYPATVTLYCVIGLVFTALIALRWRTDLWRLDAPANRR